MHLNNRSYNVNAYLVLCLSVVMAVFIYWPCFTYTAVNWDDDDNIRANPRVQNLSIENLKYHFEHERYKSLALWSYSLEYQIHGSDYGKYHRVNLILHLLNICMIFIVGAMFLKKRLLAALAAMLFAIHPMFVEPVVWITGRKDLLYMLFFMLSIITYYAFLKSVNIRRFLFLLLSIALTYAASMVKIQAFTIPFVFLLMDVYFKRKFRLELFLEKIAMLALIPGLTFLFLIFFLLYFFLNLYRPAYLWIKTMYNTRIPYALKKYLTWFLFLLSLFVFIQTIDYDLITSERLSHSFAINAFLYIVECIVIFISFVILINNIPILSTKIKTLRYLIDKINMIPFYINNNKIIVSIILFLGIAGVIFSFNVLVERMGLFTLQPDDSGYIAINDRLVLGALSLIFYLKSFFIQGSFNPMHKYPDQNGPELFNEYQIYIYLSITIIIALTILIIRYWKNHKHILFWVVFFFIQISIVLHVIPIEGKVVYADRYTYPAYPGLIIAFILVLDKLQIRWKRPWLFMGLFPIIILYFTIETHARIPIWKNSHTFWKQAVKEDKKNAYAQDALGISYLNIKNNPDSAYHHISTALALNKNYTEFYTNMGRALYALDSIKASVPYFDTAISRSPNNPFPYNNRASAYLQQGKYRDAIKDYKMAVKLLPHDTVFRKNLVKARKLYRMDSIIKNNIQTTHYTQKEKIQFVNDLGARLIRFNKINEAIDYLELGLSLDDKHETILNNLAYAYSLNADYNIAVTFYDRLTTYFPENPDYHYYKGNVLWNMEQYHLACKAWEKAHKSGSKAAIKHITEYCQ